MDVIHLIGTEKRNNEAIVACLPLMFLFVRGSITVWPVMVASALNWKELLLLFKYLLFQFLYSFSPPSLTNLLISFICLWCLWL